MWYYLSMEIAKIIGSNIKKARKQNKLTQTAIAKLLGMTQQQYSRFETGIFELNYKQILEICRILEISPNDVFEI